MEMPQAVEVGLFIEHRMPCIHFCANYFTGLREKRFITILIDDRDLTVCLEARKGYK